MGGLTRNSPRCLNNNALSGEIPAALGGLTVLTADAPPQQQSERAPPGGVGEHERPHASAALQQYAPLLSDPLPSTLTNLTISELHVQNTQITATTTDAALEDLAGGENRHHRHPEEHRHDYIGR